MEWPRLGAVAPGDLREARIELHWAAQVICAAADRWIAPKADDSHTDMEWRAEHGALIGNVTEAGRQIGLRPADLTLLALAADGRFLDTFALAGRTLSQALGWADERIAEGTGATPRGIVPRDYDMPEHAVRTGAPFSAERAALAEIDRWYAAADALLRDIAAGEPYATPIRCWPHHFDIASIVFVDGDSAAPEARQIGFGLSPGDHYYAQPYFYLTPFPIAPGASFPDIDAGGHWHREGFTGAILVGSKLTELSGAADQLARARAFFASAFAAARAVMVGSTAIRP